MSARITEGWRVHDIPALVLENAALRLRVLPELGAHVLEASQAAGRARILQPGESLETDVAFVLFSGLDAVGTVQQQGDGFTVR